MPSSISSSEPRRTSARPWPTGLLLGLACFVAAERLAWHPGRLLESAARYTPPGPDGDALRVDAALGRLDPGRPGTVPLLLLGSSQVREGLDCGLLAQTLGRPCYNLAISAGSPLDVLTIAHAYDARLPRRQAVLGLFPKVLHVDPKAGFVSPATLACVWQSGAARGLRASQWSGLADGLWQRLSPTLRYKDALAAAYTALDGHLAAAWNGSHPPAPERLLAGERPKPPAYFAAHLGRLDGDAPRPGPVSAAQELALERFLERERRAGRPVVVLDFPTRPGYESTQAPETLDHYRALLARLARQGGLRLVPAAALGPLEPEDFQDFTHLSERGRARVSRRLAALLTEAAAP